MLPFLCLGFYNLVSSRQQGKKSSLKSFLFLVMVPLFFYAERLGHDQPGFALALVVTALLLPGSIDFCLKTGIMRKVGIAVMILLAVSSLIWSGGFFPRGTSLDPAWDFPSLAGVKGTQAAAV